MKRIIIFAITVAMTLLNACGLLNHDEVRIKARELILDREVKEHVGYDQSGYYEIEYNGPGQFDIVLEAWENGSYSHDVGSFRSYLGKDLRGISISLEEAGDTMDMKIGIHYKKIGSTIGEINIPKNGYTGYYTTGIGTAKTGFPDSEDMYIFGLIFHRSTVYSFPDVTEVAKLSEYAVLMKITPVE